MLCYEYEKIREKRYSKTGPTKEKHRDTRG